MRSHRPRDWRGLVTSRDYGVLETRGDSEITLHSGLVLPGHQPWPARHTSCV